MRVPLVATREASSKSGVGLFPSTDSQAKIIYLDDDGHDLCRYTVNKVSCMDQLANKQYEKPFEFNEPNPGTWEVVLTDKRITFYNPMTIGIFGKTPKVKSGKASVGHLNLKNVFLLRAGFMGPSLPYISLGCKRYDNTTSYILIFASQSTLEDLARNLEIKITECVNKTGAGMQEEGEFLEMWNKFFDSDLFDGKDHLTAVPSKQIKQVANSEIAPV